MHMFRNLPDARFRITVSVPTLVSMSYVVAMSHQSLWQPGAWLVHHKPLFI
jgi:hypothetical protein